MLVGISLEEMERRLIEATLAHYEGHRARTAKALGIGIRTLSGKLRQYGYAPREKPGDEDAYGHMNAQFVPQMR
jgi:DNA-binding NtrC family response regulator